MTRPTYPQPYEDADNRPFLEGWREGKLFIQRCVACCHLFHYPRPFCPACFSPDIEWIESAGTGTLVSYSLVHRPNVPAFSAETPIILGEIMLDEGPTMLARVLDHEHRCLGTNARVQLVHRDTGRRYPLPIFEPAKIP